MLGGERDPFVQMREGVAMGGMEKLELRNWGVREASREVSADDSPIDPELWGGRDVPPKSLAGPIRRSDRLGSGRLTVGDVRAPAQTDRVVHTTENLSPSWPGTSQ